MAEIKADSDRAQWQYVRESIFGLTPTGASSTQWVVDEAGVIETDAISVSGGCLFFSALIFPCEVGDCLDMSGWSNSENNIIVCVDEVLDGGKTVCVSPYDENDELVDEDLSQTITMDCGHHETTQEDVETKVLRWTGDSIQEVGQFEDSKEIRQDRRLSDIPRVQASVQGELNFEFTQHSFDDFLIAAIQGKEWTAQIDISAATTIQCSVGGNYTFNAGVPGSIQQYDWILINGFDNNENNGIFQVVQIASNTVTTTNALSVVEAAGESVTVSIASKATDGTTPYHFSMERAYTDLKPVKFARYNGMTVNELEMRVNAEQIITGTMALIGKREASSTSYIGDGSPELQNTQPVMTGAEFVLGLRLGNAALGAMEFVFKLKNNLRAKSEIGEIGPVGVGVGGFRCEGAIRAYLESEALLDYYLNNTELQNLVLILDSEGSGSLFPQNTYIFEIPLVKFTNGKRVAGGQNQPILADMEFRSMRDNSRDYQFRMAKLVKG